MAKEGNKNGRYHNGDFGCCVLFFPLIVRIIRSNGQKQMKTKQTGERKEREQREMSEESENQQMMLKYMHHIVLMKLIVWPASKINTVRCYANTHF